MNVNAHPLPSRHRFTVEDYHRLGEAGVLSEDDRVELIEGEIIDMAPIGSDHAGLVTRLNRVLVRAVGDRALVSVQNPIRLTDQSEPQPDFALLKPRADDYRTNLPTPSEVLWVIEVADTSLAYDRSVKVPLYARHGIPEVWLIDLAGQAVEVFLDPAAEGYREVRRYGPADRLRPALLPDLEVDLAAVLG
ncbi:Uma2 family endonuclease [Candidatus Methylocalor cossyra]|uniref:Uma2 domain-containing protein n=1 Tax=Candidatus Methylocalor cossyra TaxID=3108543 RepID=A0ABP1CCS3_9GAMM